MGLMWNVCCKSHNYNATATLIILASIFVGRPTLLALFTLCVYCAPHSSSHHSLIKALHTTWCKLLYSSSFINQLDSNQMHLRGFRNLCFFYVCWLGGSFIIPFAAITALLKWTYVPTYIVIAYYTFRVFFKAHKWDFMRDSLCADDTPYFNSAK